MSGSYFISYAEAAEGAEKALTEGIMERMKNEKGSYFTMELKKDTRKWLMEFSADLEKLARMEDGTIVSACLCTGIERTRAELDSSETT